MAPDSDAENPNEVDFDDGYAADAYDGNELDAGSEINYEERFNAAAKDIKKKKGFTSNDEVQDFLRQYHDIAGKFVPKVGKNLLHALVDMVNHTDELEPGGVTLLVRRIVEEWPSLLQDVYKGYNPVFMAIRDSQHELANHMISACKERVWLDSALGAKDQSGMTCLHAAFKDNINAQTTRTLVENASDDVLAAQDDSGCTPMHYAVAYLQCMNPRAEIINLLIDRDLKALQNGARRQRPGTFLDRRAKSGNSVYMELEQGRAPQFKSFVKYMAGKGQGTGSSTRTEALLADAAKKSTRISPRDPLRDKTRDPRPGASAEPSGDRSIEKPSSNGDADDDLEKRERLREQRRAEEAKKKADQTKTPATVGEETRRPEGRTGNPDRHREPSSNMGMKRTFTGLQERAKKERAKDELVKDNKPEKTTSTKQVHGAGVLRTLERLRNSDAILLRLKLHYMRTRSAEMVIPFLYGNNLHDVQISFDYDRLPRKVLWNEFVKRFGKDAESGLRFDPVLQYVTFPRVEVFVKGRQADAEREAENKSGVRQVGPLGRKDMQYFFDWLYKKGVRHIIRVSVEDSGDSGEKVHSDKAIGQSLERFVVEHLDWKKTDLDPETILRASSNVERRISMPGEPEKTEIVSDRQLKELYLRWSGSNAVLRGWSEPEGLATLPHLKEIRLFIPSAGKLYDNEPWIETKVNEFQTRLRASQQQAARARALLKQSQLEPTAATIPDAGDIRGEFNSIKVSHDFEGTDEEGKLASQDAPHLAASGPVKGVNSHRWLDSTAKFAGEMTAFWESTVNNFVDMKQSRPMTSGLENDVVLALIDDGVDRFDIPQTDQVFDGKSFDFHGGKVRPSYSSAKGHGTIMTSMILRVCPMAKVYPIRLKTYDNPEGKNMKIDAGYAAKAIRAALDKNATIISMSWTVPMTECEGDAKRQLRMVLQEAVDNHVLMFCSAPDEGKFSEDDYPSGPWRDRFFRIGAANSDGTVYGWTPEDGITYVLPGVDVIKEHAANSSFDAESIQSTPNRLVEFHETGSSVATALAAGLAAMIIYCVKASVLTVLTANNNSRPLLGTFPENAAKVMAQPDEMKRAFASLGKVTPNKFIQVWDELDKISEQLETLRTPTSTVEMKDKSVEAFVEFGQRLWGAAKKEH